MSNRYGYLRLLLFFLIAYSLCIVAYSTPHDLISRSDMVIQPSIPKSQIKEPPYYQHEYVTPHGSDFNAVTNKHYVDASISESIYSFQEWFKVKVQTSDQMIEVAAVLIATYYNNLRQCLVGTYKYPTPNILFGWHINNQTEPKYFLATSTIKGLLDGKCKVETLVNKHNQLSKTQCDYSPGSLDFFTDKNARAAARNKFSYKKSELDKLQQMIQECQPVNPDQTSMYINSR